MALQALKRDHLFTRGSEQPFILQPAMKALSEGSASGCVLPAWVQRAWRVSIFKWAAIGQWSRSSVIPPPFETGVVS